MKAGKWPTNRRLAYLSISLCISTCSWWNRSFSYRRSSKDTHELKINNQQEKNIKIKNMAECVPLEEELERRPKCLSRNKRDSSKKSGHTTTVWDSYSHKKGQVIILLPSADVSPSTQTHSACFGLPLLDTSQLRCYPLHFCVWPCRPSRPPLCRPIWPLNCPSVLSC